MWFAARSTAKTAIKVLTLQHKLGGLVDIDRIQPILKNDGTRQIKQLDGYTKVIPQKYREQNTGYIIRMLLAENLLKKMFSEAEITQLHYTWMTWSIH